MCTLYAWQVSTASKRKQKKSGKYAAYECAPDNAIYFLFDVETTGGKRNWDRIVAISLLACDDKGKILGSFTQLVNPEGVENSAYILNNIHSKLAHTCQCHIHTCDSDSVLVAEIQKSQLRNKPKWKDVVPKLNRWFDEQLEGHQTGVLVSHNTPVDIQFLMCEYMRAKTKLPSKIRLGLDTLKTTQRFSSLCYQKVSPSEWPVLTKKGKLSMGVKPMATYALSKLDPPKSFADFCGQHHDADADTRAVHVILFDQKQFGRHGLHHCVFNSNRKCFQPIEEVRSAMQIKMRKPVLEMETLPRGWVPAPVNTTNSHMHVQCVSLLFLTHIIFRYSPSSRIQKNRFQEVVISCPTPYQRCRKRLFARPVTNVGKGCPLRNYVQVSVSVRADEDRT